MYINHSQLQMQNNVCVKIMLNSRIFLVGFRNAEKDGERHGV